MGSIEAANRACMASPMEICPGKPKADGMMGPAKVLTIRVYNPELAVLGKGAMKSVLFKHEWVDTGATVLVPMQWVRATADAHGFTVWHHFIEIFFIHVSIAPPLPFHAAEIGQRYGYPLAFVVHSARFCCQRQWLCLWVDGWPSLVNLVALPHSSLTGFISSQSATNPFVIVVLGSFSGEMSCSILAEKRKTGTKSIIEFTWQSTFNVHHRWKVPLNVECMERYCRARALLHYWARCW